MAGDFITRRPLSAIVADMQVLIDEIKAIPSIENTLGTSSLLPSEVRGALPILENIVSELYERGFISMAGFNLARPLNVILPEILAIITETPAAPVAIGELEHRYFTVGTGPQAFNISSGFAGRNLIFTVESAEADAQFTLNRTTGAMVVETLKPSSGNVTIRATNDQGFAEQVFPLFVVQVVSYTILARDDNGGVTVESLASVPRLIINRQSDGTVLIEEA